MSRVALAGIPALTFYQHTLTSSRRTDPIPQLICVGKACNLYTPEVVRCVNLGGQGTEVDWKCEADLPESLRFGRVEVSCEGWSRPGDPYVLKGSCSLEYRLVEVPKILRSSDSHSPRSRFERWFQSTDSGTIVFTTIWTAFLVFILYSMLKSCLQRSSASSSRGQRPPPPNSHPRSSGWFPGDYRGDDWNAPPPYSKHAPDPPQNQTWRPGFWTGAALGGLGASFLNNRRNAGRTDSTWDWERNRRTSFFTRSQAPPNSEDRGEGSSNLGSMRRSTGFGGSNVR